MTLRWYNALSNMTHKQLYMKWDRATTLCRNMEEKSRRVFRLVLEASHHRPYDSDSLSTSKSVSCSSFIFGKLISGFSPEATLKNGHLIIRAAACSSTPSPTAQNVVSALSPPKRSRIHSKHCSFPTTFELYTEASREKESQSGEKRGFEDTSRSRE